VSPAEASLVYAAVPVGSSTMRWLRSTDGGATFAQVREDTSMNPLCVYGVSLLQADVSDPPRVFRSARCLAGRDLAGGAAFSQPLERSLDQGVTWAEVSRPTGGFSNVLAGGAGTDPSRYYLADYKPFFSAPSSLYRSDDGGASFSQVFQFPPSSLSGAPDASGAGPHTVIGGLAYEPRDAARVFMGRRNRATGVLTSGDGGVTFAELGRQDIGEVSDLALSADGLDLYAATDRGVFRLSLREGIPQPPAPAIPAPPTAVPGVPTVRPTAQVPAPQLP
jgi:hypothetical protein